MKFYISRSGLEYVSRHLDRSEIHRLLSDCLTKLQKFEIDLKKEFFVSKLVVTVKENQKVMLRPVDISMVTKFKIGQK